MSNSNQARRCPNCNFSNFPASSKFCPKCGLKLSASARTRRKHSRTCECGVVFETIKLSWCPFCGKPLQKILF
ncbi:MAG: zinc ribbon domain-containing protein [Candidatus Helarchaeota archaeon]